MKFQTLSYYVVALLAALLLAACGGGGASRNPNLGGPISVSPEDGTFYAGMASTITVSGGRPPFAITSSEPGILPVPPIVNGNSFQVIPNNPGVVDVGLPEGSLPVRTVIISVRDSTGILVSASIKVAQNFLTGYGFFIGASTCAANAPCAGGETGLLFDTTFNGSLHGLEKFRIEKVRGPYQFVDPLNSNNLVDSVIVDSDHQGTITTVIRVLPNIPSQVAIVRVTHVKTGATVEYTFTINATSATASLTVLPPDVTLTGATDQFCGTGSADVYVFDGQTPYTAFCVDRTLNITPSTSTSNPGRFTISATDNTVCLDASPCVITDATGARVTVPVTTERGPAPTPPPPLSVSPTTMTLACGQSGTITVVGGTGTYTATTDHSGVQAMVTGANSVSVTRIDPDPALPAGNRPTTATVTINDGSQIRTVAITITPDDAATGRCT